MCYKFEYKIRHFFHISASLCNIEPKYLTENMKPKFSSNLRLILRPEEEKMMIFLYFPHIYPNVACKWR